MESKPGGESSISTLELFGFVNPRNMWIVGKYSSLLSYKKLKGCGKPTQPLRLPVLCC